MTGLAPELTYNFKIRARNIYGYGPFSGIASINTTDKPYAMDPVNTVQSGTNIVLSWTAPQSGGEPINSYQVLLYIPSTNSFVEDLTYCDASQNPAKTNLNCTFDMNYLNQQYGF